jgi:hypothetical protein
LCVVVAQTQASLFVLCRGQSYNAQLDKLRYQFPAKPRIHLFLHARWACKVASLAAEPETNVTPVNLLSPVALSEC